MQNGSLTMLLERDFHELALIRKLQIVGILLSWRGSHLDILLKLAAQRYRFSSSVLCAARASFRHKTNILLYLQCTPET
jgi:hypothetical protein